MARSRHPDACDRNHPLSAGNACGNFREGKRVCAKYRCTQIQLQGYQVPSLR